MTGNQLRYAELLETRRNNIVVSTETNRHNVTVENETQRHNLADESIRYQANAINAQHYANQDAAGFMNAASNARQAAAAEQNAATNYGNYINSAYQVEGQRQYWSDYNANQQTKIQNDYRLGVQKNLIDAFIGSGNLGVNRQNAATNAQNAETNRKNAETNAKNATTNAINIGANYLRGAGSFLSGIKGINIGGSSSNPEADKFWNDLFTNINEGESINE